MTAKLLGSTLPEVLNLADPTGLRVRLGELENPGFHHGAFSAHPSSYQG
jgi:hypothetical protein